MPLHNKLSVFSLDLGDSKVTIVQIRGDLYFPLSSSHTGTKYAS